VSTHRVVFIMFKKIENPTACGMWCVIHFLNVKDMKLPELCQLCDLYGEHAMSSQWYGDGCDSLMKDAKCA